MHRSHTRSRLFVSFDARWSEESFTKQLRSRHATLFLPDHDIETKWVLHVVGDELSEVFPPTVMFFRNCAEPVRLIIEVIEA